MADEMKWVLLVMALAAAGPIAFEERAKEAGLDFVSHSSPTEFKNQPETMVSGVGLIDYDNDGDLDVFFVNGGALPSLEKEGPQYWNRLYRNDGNGKFTDVTERAGVRGAGYGMGVAVGDFDNDGWADLYIANVTENQLLRNNHDGTFTDVTAQAGVGGARQNGRKMWSISALWVDYDHDGKLDLFVSNYCVWEVNKDPLCGPNKQIRAYCHPKHYAPLPGTLYHNEGGGRFRDVSQETGILAKTGKGMGAVMADYDGDGWIDIFVANDNVANHLFHNIQGKRFEEVALQAGVAYPMSAVAISGMGADFRDVNNDGKPDLWHTAIENESFPLYLNEGANGFAEVTDQSQLYKTRNMSGWSNGIFDFDNDGWKDLFVARGNVMDNISKFSVRPYEEPNTIFRNLGKGRFEEAVAGVEQPGANRGTAFGDVDNDGRVDVVVSVLNGRARYYRNVSPGGAHWVSFRLKGTKSNRMGLGAQLRVVDETGRTQWNQATTGVGFASSSDARVHFGLGEAKRLKEVEVVWPSRVRQVLRDVEVDRVVEVVEP